MVTRRFEEAEHAADWALVVRGQTLDELFENAARGMLELMEVQPGNGPKRRRTIRLQAPDSESLLVAWLEELLYGVEVRRVAYSEFEVRCRDGTSLVARVKEGPASTVQRLIKAVTFHGLRVERMPDGLRARIVFDV